MRIPLFILALFFVLGLVAFASWSVLRLLPISGRCLVWSTVGMTFGLVFLFVLTLLPLLDKLPFWLSVTVYQTGNTLFIGAIYTAFLFFIARLLVPVRLVPQEWLRCNWWTLAAYGVLIFALFIGGYVHYKHKKRIEIRLEGQGVERPVRFVVASDLHLGYHNRSAEVRRWVDLINKEKPDAVLIVGDLVDHSTRAIREQNIMAELRRLQAPVYMVLGNHEYIARLGEVCDILQKSNITLLRDSVVSIGGVSIIGRDDRINRRRRPLRHLLEQAVEGQPVVVLDHQPSSIPESVEANVALQLSGHTHHGQLWPASLFTDLLYDNAYGSRKIGSTLTYTSSGLGIWGAKVRIGTRSEFLILTIDN